MRNWKKMAVGAAILTTGLFLGQRDAQQADAEYIHVKDIKIDYEKQALSVEESSDVQDTKVYVSFPTVSVTTKRVDNNSVTQVTVKDKEWVAFDYEGRVDVDLSSLAVAKDMYVHVRGNKNQEPVLVKIAASPSKLSGSFEPTGAEVTVSDIKDRKAPVELDDVECCTTNGSWQPVSEVDFTMYQKRGATLRFRQAPSEAAKVLNQSENLGTDAAGNAVKAFLASGQFASREVKIKIPRIANAPKIKVDYDKQELTVPVTCEYRITGNGDEELGSYNEVELDENDKPMKVAVQDLGVESGVIDVRVMATEKKPASRYVEIPYQSSSLTVISTLPDVDTEEDRMNADVLTNCVTASEDLSEPDIRVTECKPSKNETDTVTVTNYSKDIYQIIASEEAEIPMQNAAGAKSVGAAGKSPKKLSLKVPEGSYLFVRKAGNSKAKTWSSMYAPLGVAGK